MSHALTNLVRRGDVAFVDSVARADDEIQVYNAEIAEVGQWTITTAS